jgi:hypothetical protein
MASMLPATQARSSIGFSAESAPQAAIRTELLAALSLQLRLAAPLDAAVGSAIIEGGQARGRAFAGEILPGSLEWSRDSQGLTQLVVRYGVQTHAGHRIQLVDRAKFSTAEGAMWNQQITSTTEMEASPDPLAAAARGVLIGRLDASAIGAGVLRLDLHRVI